MLKSIEFNFQFSSGKTRKFGAELQPGSTMITGRNGNGKSLILETFSFLLFGAEALRGVASDYKKISAECVVTIRDKDYAISRTKTKAEIRLAGAEEPLASGVTAVNAFIVELLGYDYQVYRISNWCAQGDIQALANMKPTARKAMIDQVAGLTQVDGLITLVKGEVRELKAKINGIESALVEPVAPLPPDIEEQQVAAELERYTLEHAELLRLVDEMNQLAQVIAPVKPEPQTARVAPFKPEPLKAPEAPQPPSRPEPKPELLEISVPEVVAHSGATADEVLARVEPLEKELHSLVDAVTKAKESLARNIQAMELEAADREMVKGRIQGTTLAYWEEQNQQMSLKLQYDRLLEQGDVGCPNCGTRHPVASDSLAKFDTSKFPSEPPLPVETVRRMFEIEATEAEVIAAEQALSSKFDDHVAAIQRFEQIRSELATYKEQLAENERRQAKYEDQLQAYKDMLDLNHKNWERECASVAERNAERLASWERECENVAQLNEQIDQQNAKAQDKYEVDYTEYLLKTQRLQSLKEQTGNTEEQLDYIEGQLAMLKQQQTNWGVYHQLQAQYLKHKESYDTAKQSLQQDYEFLEDRQRAHEALVELKSRVKTYLIPSLNKVASYLLSEMTGGAFNEVAIDENFEVYVDGEPLRTMSGSGKDITNLALRIGLGRILTHKVLGMMMLDEIDQGMDAERAEYTWQCIEKVTPQIGQVLVVSHKELHAENRLVVE